MTEPADAEERWPEVGEDPSTAQVLAGHAGALPNSAAGDARRHGTGLCLSGGGYRAALFHLGATRRLNELGVLGAVRTISAASGGAITANLLADPRLGWPGETGRPVVQGFEEFVAEPLRALTARNVRTPALLKKALPTRWFMKDSTARALADEFAESVPWWSKDLRDNGTDGPAIFTGSTEVAYGVDWVFADPTAVRPHGRVGDYRLGYADPPEGLRLADAIAASCAYPPFFGPMVLDGDAMRLAGGHPGHVPADRRAALRKEIRLTDGGVYDNLALEPVWKDHRDVLVSDGGGVFRARTTYTWWGEMLRILGIATGGGRSTRLRWLHASFARNVMGGATWGLADVVPGTYPAATAELINAIRTDLDAFSAAEQQILERHGYVVADRAVRRYAAGLVLVDAPLVPPHPEVADPAVAAAALQDSARRTLLGRF
jgi:NTE family protein